MGCGAGRRHGSDLALLWLWRRLAATALIRPLAWELPYATGVALKKDKNTEKQKTKNKTKQKKKRKKENRNRKSSVKCSSWPF